MLCIWFFLVTVTTAVRENAMSDCERAHHCVGSVIELSRVSSSAVLPVTVANLLQELVRAVIVLGLSVSLVNSVCD